MTHPTHEIKGRAGRVEIFEQKDVLLVRPGGYVSRRMLLRGLAEATEFGNSRPHGWWHVTDSSRFVVPAPVNPFLLRRIQKLPNVRGYVLIVPSRLLRLVARIWRRIINADVVVASEDEARAWISQRVRD